MAKILKHFGLGNKKSTTSPAHKCKIDNSVDSPKLSRSSTTAKEQILTSPSANSPTSPTKSPFDYSQRNYSLPTADISREDQDLVMNLSGGRTSASPPDTGHQQPVYSAVIKERITPDSILSEIASKLSVSEEKSGDKMSTFGKNSKANEPGNLDSKKPTVVDRTNEKLPDILKADVTNDNRTMEYDDPYEEGPVKVSHQLDSGLSSLMSSSTTLNQVRNLDDTLEKSHSTCVGETQIGFETLKSWNVDKPGKSKAEEDGEESDNTLEGKDIHPPPIPAKTYNLANELPPPPPNLLQDNDLAEGQGPVGRAPRPLPLIQPLPRAGIPLPEDQPWDLSAKTPVNKSDTWSNGRRYEEEMLSMPSGQAPEPPMRESWRCDAPRGSADMRSRHESLMMRSAYGLEASNYPQGQYYYPPHQQMGPSPQVRHHYRSGSVRSVDYRPGIEYDEPWDQQHPFFCQTGSMPPDSMRCSYQMMPRQYSSSRASSSSWIHSMQPEKIDPRMPLEEQFWFHGTISRIEAENILRMHREGSFLVRMSESNRFDFSLSLKSTRGFMHMKIVTNPDGRYILGQFSQPFTSIPLMIHHYTIHKLPIKGAEHMSLVYPVGIELL